jgi:hypothetical protein
MKRALLSLTVPLLLSIDLEKGQYDITATLPPDATRKGSDQ